MTSFAPAAIAQSLIHNQQQQLQLQPNNRHDIDARSVSVKLDGQASIEHQIDIHVLDLIEAIENPDIHVIEVLQGLKYVADYRLQNEKLPHLDLGIMKRLAQGLLEYTQKKRGNLLSQRPTEEAELSLLIFFDFLANIIEFRQTVGEEFSASDLRYRLKLHRYAGRSASTDMQILVVSILGLLTKRFAQFRDWHDLVEEDEHEDIESLIKEHQDKFSNPRPPKSPSSSTTAGEVVPSESEEEILYPPPALYFDKNSEALAGMFRSSTSTGLDSNQIPGLRKVYGENRLPPPQKASILKMLWAQLTDFMVLILLIASIVEFATGDFKSAIVLLTVVVINVIIGVTQEYKAGQALEALLTLTVAKASVVRDGKQAIIESWELVPGDLVVLEEGEAVPADLRLCEVAQLDIVESILTGESLGVSKSVRTIRKRTRKLPLGECKGNTFMTTVVARGRGKGIVVRTGESTEIGKISRAIASTPHTKTNIEVKLSTLGFWLVIISVVLVIIIVVVGIAWKRNVKDMVLIGISLAVSVIPEGLVAVVTISMAMGVQRMAKLNAIVRKLPSVETVGSVTVICSDKTGTLTEGKMGAQQVWSADNLSYLITHSTSLDPNKGDIQQTTSTSLETGIKSNTLSISHLPKPITKEISKMPGPLVATLVVASLCNNSGINKSEDSKEGWKSVGDPTEVALLVAGIKGGLSRDLLTSRESGFAKLGDYAFDSDRKMMSSIYSASSASFSSSRAFVFAKGAPEAVVKRCTSYIVQDDLKGFEYLDKCPSKPVDEAYIEYLSQQSASMASCGLRVLAMAFRSITVDEGNSIVKQGKHGAAESSLTFVGLIGLIDPPKAGVKESITTSKRAGIRVIMITGDHITTATAIAKDLGIVEPDNPNERRAMEGYEVDLLSEEALAAQKPFPVIFARVSPDNKLKIVKALQRQGQSVVMTGDGVNDAPAIKQADVGVSMGIAGTEITKQAADIILANDDFTTIVAAVKEGRQVYDNILKFVVYLLSCNAAEVLLFLCCVIINVDLPFTSIQILWANIFADIPPALSLGLEPGEPDVMDRKPRPPKENVLTGINITAILFQSSLMTIITFTVYCLTLSSNFAGADTIIKRESFTFILLTTMQLVQSFLSRSITLSVFTTGITGNKILVFAFFLSYGLLLMGLEIPAMSAWLGLTDPGGPAWAVVWIAVVIQIICVETMKYIMRRFFLYQGQETNEKIPLRSIAVVGSDASTS